MAEDLSNMKAKKTSKADSFNKLINSVGSAVSDSSKPKKNSSSKNSSSKSTTKKSTTQKKTSSSSTSKSASQKKSTTQSTSTDTQPVKRGRGRPRKYPRPEEQNVAEKIINTTVSKSAKKVDKAVKKSFKKQGLSLILLFTFLFVGICGGFVISRYVVFNVLYPNDTYEMVAFTQGEKKSYDVYIKQDTIDSDEEFTYSTYNELGIKCIAFGKDYSADYTVQYYYRNDLSNEEVPVNKIDTSKEGIYYAVYSVKPTKYKYVKLIRNIIVLRGEDNE